jgi:RNA polymerase sigma-70 factor (ECF subfamily)
VKEPLAYLKGGIIVEDHQIIELYWHKNEDAIKETDRKYGAYCFAIANNILHNTEDSEECVNDTWLSAWNAIPPQKPRILQMFLAKITRNLSFNRFISRSAKKRGGGEINLVLDELAECIAGEADVEREYAAKELEQCIRLFVRALPVRDGNVFVRRYFFTEPVWEIAKRYNLSENNVLVILSRTRKKLKMHLIKEGFFSE